MKKVIAVLSVLALLLSGCASGEGEEKTYSLSQTPFSVSFREGETVVSGVMSYVSPQEMTLSLSSPKEADGLVFSLKNGEFLFGFDGVFCRVENIQSLFGNSKGFQTLFEAFSALGKSETKISKRKSKFSYPLGEAVASFDESGFLSAVRAGSYDFEFTKITESA